jgi:hypothetical protein
MKHHYKDITEKLGDPQWWDEVGVPRYCDFSPMATNDIYISEAVLLEIACQGCGRRFKVAMSWDDLEGHIKKIPPLAQSIDEGTIHYGDPPNYECCLAGPTMNSEPLRVLEYWRMSNLGEWERQTDYERELRA